MADQQMNEQFLSTHWATVLVPVFFGLGVTLAVTERGFLLLRKFQLYATGGMFMVLSKDFSWKEQPDPDLIKDKVEGKKRIIFVRHGETYWNEVFNKGFGPSFLVRLVKAIFLEIGLLPSPDSVFYDTPLNTVGINQCQDLRAFLANPSKEALEDTVVADDLVTLQGKDKPSRSIVVCSNLRRTMQTAAIGLWDRLQRTEERVHVLSSCQEVSRNIDCVPLSTAKSLPPLSGCNDAIKTTKDVSKSFNADLNFGNRDLSSNGLLRMRDFSEWAFKQKEEVVVVTGHSIWFRSFFRSFLPRATTHTSKTRKMFNAGVVAFDLTKGLHNNETLYRVDPNSITNIYKGFS